MLGIYDMLSIYIFVYYFEEEMGERNLYIRNINYELILCLVFYVQYFFLFLKYILYYILLLS